MGKWLIDEAIIGIEEQYDNGKRDQTGSRVLYVIISERDVAWQACGDNDQWCDVWRENLVDRDGDSMTLMAGDE